MRNRKALRLISMLLTLAMLLSSSAAMADIITVKNSVSAYAEPDGQNVALQIGAGTYDVSRYNNEYYQYLRKDSTYAYEKKHPESTNRTNPC